MNFLPGRGTEASNPGLGYLRSRPVPDMSTDRTEVEWPYRPSDFFEAPYRGRSTNYELVADAGRVLVTLAKPQDPVPEQLRDQMQLEVHTLFRLRQLQVHRTYELENPRIYQHHSGGK